MAEEIFMDLPEVRKMGTDFGEMADKLNTVSKTMEKTIQVLKASSFMGMFGNYAMANYLERIQPIIEGSAKKFGELGSDLSKSADAYERGDAAGATKFH